MDFCHSLSRVSHCSLQLLRLWAIGRDGGGSEVTGFWMGTLLQHGIALRIVLHVTE